MSITIISLAFLAMLAMMLIGLPIAVSMASAALGLDRLGRSHWIGIGLSALGMYLVVGLGARLIGHLRARQHARHFLAPALLRQRLHPCHHAVAAHFFHL